MEDPKNNNQGAPDDLEMGASESEPKNEEVKVNNYLNDIKPAENVAAESQPKVNPVATPPPITPDQGTPIVKPPVGTAPVTNPPINNNQGKTIGQVRTGTVGGRPVGNPAAKKKALMGCLGFFGAIMMIFLVLSFIFIAQSGPEASSPIAKLLGVNQASFVNGLITLIHIIFITIALVTFVFTMTGLFKASMAKKDDKVTRKEGLRSSLVAGIIFLIVLIIWAFVYVYLDGKRIQVGPDVKDPIVTDPEDTLNLSAPIEIIFNSSNVPIGSKYRLISSTWDFGDGDTGTGQIVTHIYEAKGRYDVVLEVTKVDKATGEEVVDKYSVIVSIENEALSAIIEADPQSGEAPLEVKLDASKSTDPDGNIDRYEWDLDGDGDFDDAEGVNVTHTFEKIGKYTVALRVVSTTDEYDISEKEIVVEEKQEVNAVINVVDEPGSYVTGISYTFNADDSSSPKGDIEEYEWSFSDSSKTEKTKTVSHVFKTSGSYQVTLKVTDDEGNEGEATKTIVVGSPQGTPKAVIKTTPSTDEGSSLSGSVPFTVNFDASSTTDSDDNIVDYAWDLDGNGTNDQYGEKVSYTYKNEGIYTATLTVTDSDDNVGKATVVVKAESQGLVAVLEADKVEGNVPLTVEFDASGSSYSDGSIVSYEWDFGDGTAPKLGSSSLAHKYTQIGTFTASVTVIGNDNTKSTKEILITVRETPLTACFVSVFEEGPAPLETTFDPGCSTGAVKNYFWDFGDGSTSTQVKPTHVFSDPGTYQVTLELTDADNTVSKAKVTIEVTE